MRVIVNGIFDCLHRGHESILRYAVNSGTEVFILVNTDRSAKELKGPKRPVQNLSQRVEALRGCMDAKISFLRFYIIPFDTEEQLRQTINCLEPDMILKGNDRPDVREIVGSDRWPVCILPRLKDKDGKDISTTRIINEDRGA